MNFLFRDLTKLNTYEYSKGYDTNIFATLDEKVFKVGKGYAKTFSCYILSNDGLFGTPSPATISSAYLEVYGDGGDIIYKKRLSLIDEFRGKWSALVDGGFFTKRASYRASVIVEGELKSFNVLNFNFNVTS